MGSKRIAMALAALLPVLAAGPAAADGNQAPEGAGDKWVSLFNGKDLSGWIPKIRGHAPGENPRNTFRVVDGLLTVSYDGYEKWNDDFGHLFHEKEFSWYRLRVVYRFVGGQLAGGPAWALRNSGIMVHGQSPQNMERDQKFPNSIEVQLLGGGETGERSTANLCTPGTQVFYKGKLDKTHCIPSESETFRGDQWVTVEVEVHGSELIRHFVNGKQVIEYEKPQLDNGTLLDMGSISLQSESHPVQFKSIEILVLDK